MGTHALINGEVSNQINILDRGLLYGDGVFETIAVRQRRSFLWHEHVQRLELACKTLKIAFPGEAILKKEITQLLDQYNDDAIVRITLTRGVGKRGYRPMPDTEPSRIISIHEWTGSPQEYIKTGIRLRYCDTPLAISKLAGIKHLNRLEQVLAQSEWNEEEGIQEGLMLDHNHHVIEGTMSNVFIVKNKQLVTPDLSQSGVAGVMRRCVINLAKEHGVEVQEAQLTKVDISNADEVFVTNSVIGLWPVESLNDITWPAPGKLTKEIMQLIADKRSAGGIEL